MPFLRTYDHLFIGGEWVQPHSDARIEVVSPIDETTIGTVPVADTTDVDAAVAAARRAFDNGPWPRLSPPERAAVVRRVREGIAMHAEELAVLTTEEMGSPITQSRTIQVGSPLRLLDDFLDLMDTYQFRELRTAPSGDALVVREPVGVVAAIVPWNVPLMVALMKITPAILAGCTVVFKPAPQTPLTTFALVKLFEEAGLPAGVLNVIPAELEASEYLVGHPDIDKITFTGSSAAGRRIAEIGGRNLRRVTLELGGKSAGIVLDDADMNATMEALRLGSLRNSGQICTLKTRLLVSRNRKAEFVDALSELVRSMPVGDPRDDATEIGPMVTARQRDTVQGHIDSGKSQGASVVFGGGAPPRERGWFVAPTVFADVDPGMRIAQEEIFGPVLSVITYDSEDDAIRFANDSVYGLNGAVYTADPQRGLALAARIRTGVVELNGYPVGYRAPIGGVKASGLGREAGVEGLEEYLQPKSYGLPPELRASFGAELSDR